MTDGRGRPTYPVGRVSVHRGLFIVPLSLQYIAQLRTTWSEEKKQLTELVRSRVIAGSFIRWRSLFDDDVDVVRAWYVEDDPLDDMVDGGLFTSTRRTVDDLCRL